jgi:hypothetical protein
MLGSELVAIALAAIPGMQHGLARAHKIFIEADRFCKKVYSQTT